MSYTLTGQSLIDGQWTTVSGASFAATNPATGQDLEPQFATATLAEVNRAFAAAKRAAAATRNLPPERRARLLENIAAQLTANGEQIVQRAAAESALPAQPRLSGELVRTASQLKLFAELVREGSWVDAVIDRADPARQPQPKPDLRRVLQPLGPVVVFGASNFPLAFGVAGGDTASALAAGDPVLAKGNPYHPGTNELVAEAIRRALEETALDPGLFALLQGVGNELGEMMVGHQAAAAVGFTGSIRGGRALFDLAARRANPIPVYAEMGSLNPLVVLPGAIAERGAALAKGLAGSITLGAGQFCTKPGVVLVTEGAATDEFVTQLADALSGAPGFTMLSSRLRCNFTEAVQSIGAVEGVTTRIAGTVTEGASATLSLFEVDAATWRSEHALREEAFGPAAIVVRCKDLSDVLATLAATPGALTGSVHYGPQDDAASLDSVLNALAKIAGRVICNGFPTGVEVTHAMVHGGPYPATTDVRTTSVGTLAIARFARPVCYQDTPDDLLPDALKNANPLDIMRRIDGEYSREAVN
jgi:NADP-dependent aldehyde dehydrogenase